MTRKNLLSKRIFSIILALAVALSMMPMNVWATETYTAEIGASLALPEGDANDSNESAENAQALSGTESAHTNHCICGKENHQDIVDHDRENNPIFHPWDKKDSLPSEGKYYLTQNVTISDHVTLSGDLILCLNGKTVTVSSGEIKVGGGVKFTLTDCADNHGTIQGSGSVGVSITGHKDSKAETIYPASFIMYGGTLTGFSIAVKVGSRDSYGQSIFTMYGGKITRNNAGSQDGSGAAVSGLANSTHVGDNRPSSLITMCGGEISGNTGEAGGGVYIGDNCTFNMDGGKISGNTASGRDVKDPSYVEAAIPVRNGGGGVYLDSWGKFYMTRGEISNNKASGVGGGVCVMSYATSYAISITGGKITGNESTDNSGGGIYGGPAKLTIRDTEISNNKCVGSGGGISTTKPLTLENVKIIGNTASTKGGYEGGGIKIGGDSKNFEKADALTISGNTSISGNTPNNYYVDQSYLIPVKVNSNLSDEARIGICLNKDTASDDNFLPTTTSDSVVAKASEGVTLSADNFFADSFNSDYVVRTDTSGNVVFGLCDHVMDYETGYTCSNCHTKFVAVLTQEGQKDEYIRDLSGVELRNNTGTLKLLQDAVLTGILRIYSYTLTLDLNGHTIEKNGDYLGDIILGNTSSMSVIDSSENGTTDRTLDVNFNVRNSKLVLYDGENQQGFRGTIANVELYRAGTLVSCAGTISALKLIPSQEYDSDKTWNVRLWKANNQYCTIGTIQYINSYSTGSNTIIVSDLLSKNHPGAMLYGTKNGADATISGSTTIGKNGITGDYTNLYIKACKQHEPKSESDLICKECGAELVVKISATKNEETKVGYFSKDSRDTASWLSGYAEASAQLADWVAEGYTDAKLFPLTDTTREIPIACKMTLVGTGHTKIDVLVKDGADVLLDGGEYDDVTVTGGKAMLKGVKYEYYGVTVRGGEAVFESGTCSGYFKMDGGTVIIKSDTTFTNTDTTAFQVNKGTLHVEGGTIKSPVKIDNPVNLTISGGTFEKAVTITRYDNKDTGTCSISGGTFAELKIDRSNGNLSALLANGYNFYDKDTSTVANGEVKTLNNVIVRSGHTHSFDPNTGACSKCGKQMAASVTVGDGEAAYYATRNEAVDALNNADGAKMLKLFQSRRGNNHDAEYHTLTRGSVTLDLNGQWLDSVVFIAKGITLTLKSEKQGGFVSVVKAYNAGSKIIANSTNIRDDSYVTVNTISAQEGGQLDLSAGTFRDLYVVNDGSKASLSGGTYTPQSYDYGKGPDTSAAYVGAFDLLAKGYGYQKKQNTGSFAWVTDARITETSRPTYKVARIGASFEKVYPDNETNFTGDTYLIKLGEDQTTYTLKLTAVGTPEDKVSYQWQSGRDDGVWTYRPQKTDTDYEVGTTNGTITIKNLNPGTYRYRVQYTLLDSSGINALIGYSNPLTVVVTKHEHSWTYTAEGATITAKCTGSDCYLPDKIGGSVTINAPTDLIYDGSPKAATVTVSNGPAWKDKTANEIEIAYKQDDKPLNSAPIDAGPYTASIKLDDAEASVTYTIEPKTVTPTIEVINADNIVYNDGEEVKPNVKVMYGETEISNKEYDVSYSNNTKAGTATVIIKDKADGNYTITETSTDFTIQKGNPRVSVTGLPDDKDISYEDILDLKATAEKTENGGVWTWTFDEAYFKEIAKDNAAGTLTLRAIKTGTLPDASTAIKAFYTSDNYEGNNCTNVTNISKKVLTPNDLTITPTTLTKEYDGTKEHTEDITISVKQANNTGLAFNVDKTRITYNSENVKSASQATLTLVNSDLGSANDCYEFGNGKLHITISAEITPRGISIASATATDRDYEKGNKTVTISKVEFNDLPTGVTLEKDKDYEATGAMIDDKASPFTKKDVDVTVTLKNSNYKLASNTTKIGVNIWQAIAPTLTVDSIRQKWSDKSTKEITPNWKGIPDDTGNRTFSINNDESTFPTGVSMKEGWSMDTETGTLHYEIVGATERHAGEEIILKIRFTSDNYQTAYVNLKIQLTAKDTQTNFKFAEKEITKTYGDADFTVTASDQVEGSTVTYSSDNTAVATVDKNTGKVHILKSGEVTITATASATMNYSEATAKYTLNVNKKTLTIRANDKTMTVNGALPTFDVSCEGFVNEETAATVFETQPIASTTADGKTVGTFEITVTNPKFKTGMSDKYEFGTPVNGKLTVSAAPSGGGGGIAPIPPTTEVVTIDKVTTSPAEVKNETKTDADGNKETISKITVSDANQKEIIKQVKDNKSEEIVINVSEKEVADNAKLDISLDKDFIDSIAKDTDAKLTIKTPEGDKTFTQAELKKLAEATEGDTVTIDSSVFEEPTEPTEPSGAVTPAQKKIAKGVKATEITIKTVRTKSGKIILKWTKSKGYKVDYFEIYRSTKKNSGYGKKPFFRTKDGNKTTYVNTKNIKKGKTYYYKIRGVRVINGKKYYTEYSNKSWKTMK